MNSDAYLSEGCWEQSKRDYQRDLGWEVEIKLVHSITATTWADKELLPDGHPNSVPQHAGNKLSVAAGNILLNS